MFTSLYSDALDKMKNFAFCLSVFGMFVEMVQSIAIIKYFNEEKIRNDINLFEKYKSKFIFFFRIYF